MSSEQEIVKVTDKVKEYAELSKTIRVTQEKIKILNTKKKELYKELIPKLKSTNIEKCNLAFGTLKLIETNRKILPNKSNIKERYINFFNSRILEQDYCTGTAEQKATILFNFIYNISLKFSDSKKEDIR